VEPAPSSPNEQFYRLYQPATILHFFTSAIIIVLLVLFLMGLAFMQIALGLVVVVLLLAGFWKPANSIYVRMARLSKTNEPFTPLPAPRWFLALLAVQTAIVAGLFLFSGIWLIAERGLLGQNLLYALINRR
jgi:hypothetical protein